MEQAGREFCQRLELKGRRKSHRLTVASDLRNHIAPFFAGKTLERVRPTDIERADRPTVKKTETRIQFLDQAELEELLAAPYPEDAFWADRADLVFDGRHDRPASGRAAGPRWRDVDFAARKVRVVSPYVRGEFERSEVGGLGPPGADGRTRCVALRELRSQSVYSRDRDLVFCHPETGRPLDRSKLVRRFKQAIDRAGVHRITFHELRHTFGTRVAAAGTPMRTLQHWMGHADSKTTQIYAHYQPSDQEADAVDRAFA